MDFTPTTQAELARFMVENAGGPQQTICPVGGRTALTFAARQADLIVVTSDLKRVVDYPARDMTITVEAGIRIDELQSLLATEHQRLPLDIAQAERATLGGALATNASGPRRFGHGTFRDFVIGVTAVDAAGRLFKAGGRVVKNVAGYDLCKLMVGSRGTLGIVVQVTLKLRPQSETSGLLWLRFAGTDAIEPALERLLKSEARPVAIEVFNAPAAAHVRSAARFAPAGAGPVLCLGVEGTQREVDWQMDVLTRELHIAGCQSAERIYEPDAGRIWSSMTEFPTRADDPLTFQANMLPSRCMEFVEHATRLGIAVQVHAGNGIVIGQLPEEAGTIERTTAILNELRPLARSAMGNVIVLHCDPEWNSRLPMFGDSEPGWELMQRLKQTLDPYGILNPGRFLGTRTAS